MSTTPSVSVGDSLLNKQGGSHPDPVQAMIRTRRQTLLVFLASLAVYGATCARTVTLVDSGELIVACATLGVAHPPGFPVYTLIGHLFSKIPVGSVAFRLSFMSGFFAALTAALLVLIVKELAGAGDFPPSARKGRQKRSTKPATNAHHRQKLRTSPLAWQPFFDGFVPVSVGLTFAFSITQWFYATVAEVYSLNLALVSAALWLLLRWRRLFRGQAGESGTPGWVIPLAAFLYGLALGVHHATVLLFFPTILVFVWRTAGRRNLLRHHALPAIAGVIAGLSFYLYLPLAAASQPLLNWGDPSNWERFWWHVSARQYQVNLFAADAVHMLGNLGALLSSLLQQFTPVGLALALLGFPRLWRRDRTSAWLVLLIALLSIGYAINYDIAEDTQAYYLPAFLAASISLAAGWRRLWELAAHRGPILAGGVLALAVALPVVNLVAHYRQNDRHDDQIARNYVQDALAGVKPGGLLMTLDWQLVSPFLYLHHIEGFRPDVTVVDVNLVRRSWYVNTYLNRVYPQMMAACKTQRDVFLDKLRLFEYDKPYDPGEITARFTDLLNAFIDYHLPERDAHLTIPMEPGVGAGYNWVPYGLSFRLYRDREEHIDQPPHLHLKPLLADPTTLDEVARVKVRPFYAIMLANRRRYLFRAGRHDEALAQLNLALKLEPNSDTIYQFIGDLESSRGQTDAAKAAYRMVLRLNPRNSQVRRQLEAMHAVPLQPK